jgi:hypothetical protein
VTWQTGQTEAPGHLSKYQKDLNQTNEFLNKIPSILNPSKRLMCLNVQQAMFVYDRMPAKCQR